MHILGVTSRFLGINSNYNTEIKNQEGENLFKGEEFLLSYSFFFQFFSILFLLLKYQYTI